MYRLTVGQQKCHRAVWRQVTFKRTEEPAGLLLNVYHLLVVCVPQMCTQTIPAGVPLSADFTRKLVCCEIFFAMIQCTTLSIIGLRGFCVCVGGGRGRDCAEREP